MAFIEQHAASRQAFQKSIVAGAVSYWEVAPGIEFGLRHEPCGVGLALQVQRHALNPDQLTGALERRYSFPDDYANLFLFLDPQQQLVVWHALPGTALTVEWLDEVQGLQLSLLGLQDLDAHRPAY